MFLVDDDSEISDDVDYTEEDFKVEKNGDMNAAKEARNETF